MNRTVYLPGFTASMAYLPPASVVTRLIHALPAQLNHCAGHGCAGGIGNHAVYGRRGLRRTAYG